MTEQSGIGPSPANTFTADEQTAFSAALSVHYIVMVLYALGILIGSAGLLLATLGGSNERDIIIYSIMFILPLILFLLHLAAVQGLKRYRRRGYRISTGLGILLLLGFPFGTVLGALLLSQLAKFRLKT